MTLYGDMCAAPIDAILDKYGTTQLLTQAHNLFPVKRNIM